jgi:Condensation domain
LKPGSSITAAWAEKIKAHRDEILAFFAEHQGELERASAPLAAIVAGERPGLLPLSYGQERLWFIHKLQGSVQYHIPLVFRMQGNLCRKSFENAFRYITDRHEVLRTVFSEKDGDVYQSVMPGGSFTNWQKLKKQAAALKAILMQ